ncbi:sigma-70 family RNA polymerase sigma factor [Priestia megaterium]
MDDFEHEEILNNLIKQYQKQLLYTALTYVKDPYLAEDIVQQVWMKYIHLLQTEGKDSKNSPYAWLYRVTINQSIDFLRRFHNKADIPSDHMEIVRYAQNHNITLLEQSILERFDNQELQQKIKCLPHKYQCVIIYFYFKELSYREIANILNISMDTVKMRLHRARFLLRKMYPN